MRGTLALKMMINVTNYTKYFLLFKCALFISSFSSGTCLEGLPPNMCSNKRGAMVGFGVVF